MMLNGGAAYIFNQPEVEYT